MRNVAAAAAIGMAVLVAAACGAAGAGDMIIERQATTFVPPSQTAQILNTKAWISGKKIRVEIDSPAKVIQIQRHDLGVAWFVNEAQKAYMEFSLQQLEDYQQRTVGLVGRIDVKETGVSKKIGEWDCYELLITNTGGTMNVETHLWLCKDIEVDPEVRDQLIKQNRFVRQAAEKVQKMPGFPIAAQFTMNIHGTDVTGAPAGPQPGDKP